MQSQTMEQSPIKQNFELGKFISTAGKSILNLVKLQSLENIAMQSWQILYVFVITHGKALLLF